MQDYFKELDTAVYQGRFRITQNDAGNNNTIFNIKSSNGTRLILDYVSIRLSSTAANRTMYLQSVDSDGNLISYLAYGLSMGSTGSFTFPHVGNFQNNNSSGMQKVIFVNSDYLSIYLSNLAQNEYYDVSVRCRIRGRLPVVDTSGSSATPAITTNYSRIV